MGRRHRPSPSGTALPPRHRHAHQEDDQADLQDQPDDRRKSADAAEQSAAEQHAEQAGAEEARGKPAEQAAARPVEEPAAGAPKPGLPGWVMVRLNGCAMLGAVEVLGGAENVRAPREPELKPPPIRASADEIAADQRQRQRQYDGESPGPGRGRVA